jgi:hypothetical protein
MKVFLVVLLCVYFFLNIYFGVGPFFHLRKNRWAHVSMFVASDVICQTWLRTMLLLL